MPLFNGLSLRRGDNDVPDALDPATPPRYAGRTDHGKPSGFVRELQEILARLGFGFVKPADGQFDGVFGPLTEMAVREFQIYAAASTVAKIDTKSPETNAYYDRLVKQDLSDGNRYIDAEGKPLKATGVVNARTAQLLELWDKGENQFRCPVVIAAFEISGKRRAAHRTAKLAKEGGNLWKHDDLTDVKPRMYARDFTDEFRPLEDSRQVCRLERLPDAVGETKLRFGDAESSPLVFTDATTAQQVKDLIFPLTGLANGEEERLEVIGNDGGPWEVRFVGDAAHRNAEELKNLVAVEPEKLHLVRVPAWEEIGDFQTYKASGGPRSHPRSHVLTAEILPEEFTGATAASVIGAPQTFSTFRVLRAVAETECVGYFDCVNAYDSGVVSVGPCHWVFALAQSGGGAGRGELAGYLAYYKKQHPVEFEITFSRFGLDVSREWGTDGSDLYNPAIGTYSNVWWTRPQEGAANSDVPHTLAEVNYYRSWHWYYRWVMAARTRDGYRRDMYTMARFRLRDLLSAPWRDTGDDPKLVQDVGGQPATIGDVFSSEAAVALLLRWHINQPARVLTRGRAGKRLEEVLKTAELLSVIRPPNLWTDTQKERLIDSLFSAICESGPHLKPTLQNVASQKTGDAQKGWARYNGRKNLGYRLQPPPPDEEADENLEVLAETPLSRDDFEFHDPTSSETPAIEDPAQLLHPSRSFLLIPAKTDDPQTSDPRPVEPSQSFGLALIGQPGPADGQHRIEAVVLTALDRGGEILLEEKDEEHNLEEVKTTLPDRLFGFTIPVKNPPELVIENSDEPPAGIQDTLYVGNVAASGGPLPIAGDGRLATTQVTGPGDLAGKTFDLDLARVLRAPAHGTGLGEDRFLTAQLILDEVADGPNGLSVTARIEVTLDHELLPRPFRWSFATSTGATTAGRRPQWLRFAMAGDSENAAAVEFRSGLHYEPNPEAIRLSTLEYGLPLVLDSAIAATNEDGISAALRLSFAPDGSLRPELNVRLVGNVGIDLGSPLARLTMGAADAAKPLTLRYTPETGISLDLPDTLTASLQLDLFDHYQGSTAVVNNVWASANVGVEIDPSWLLKLTGNDPGTATPRAILWRNGYPQMNTGLFSKLFDKLPNANLLVDAKRRLRSLAGRVLGDNTNATSVTFAPCPSGHDTEFEITGSDARLKACMTVNIGGEASGTDSILSAEGTFVFVLKDLVKDGRLSFRPGALKCVADTLIRTGKGATSKFGNEMVSLHVPNGTAFRLICDPRTPRLEWDEVASRKVTPKRIAVRVPGSDVEPDNMDKSEKMKFTFEVEKFAIHSAGIDLRASARAERVDLGLDTDTGFASPVGVRSPNKRAGKDLPPTIGELEFKDSKLVAGSLQASAELRYFDDATGTLRLSLSQNDSDGSLDCAGTLDISGVSEFRVAAIFALFRLTAFSLGIQYKGNKWSSEARMTGRIEFTPPPGRSAREVRELSDLFSGVTVEFEDVDLLKLGSGRVRLDFPPKQFTFADVLHVDVRGLTISGANDYELEGDVTLTNLPGVDASLTLSGITVEPGETGFGPPDFRVGRIAASFDVPGGFHLEGELQFVDFEHETGFVGGFAIVTETLPRMGGIVKLTRIRAQNGDLVPSMAVFVEADYDAPLFAGFHLRSLGVGIGVYQALRGLEPSDLPLPRKIVALVDNPRGLPEPRQVESWVPSRPSNRRGPLHWMLVGSGLITYGKLERDQPHPFAGSILLAIDQDLSITAGVNLWLFTSPEETKDTAFIQRPVGRGALGISVRERSVFAMFRTLPRPKLGKDAPRLLSEVLSRVETTMMFSADPAGLLLEVGWPWATKIGPYRIGPLEGELRSGFRFGLYRGVTTFGLNYAIAVRLQASAEWGFDAGFASARAKIGVEGQGLFRASFVGALDRDFSAYLLGDVRLATTVRLYASAEASFRIKISRWIKIKKTIRFRRTLDLSINAALTAALDSQAHVGFRGEAQIAVSVCGYRLAGKVAFEYDAANIDKTRDKINKLLPPRALAAALNQETPGSIAPATDWQYRFRRMELPDGNRVKKVIRVLLFPQPGLEYPRPDSLEASRFKIPLRERAVEAGLLLGTQLAAPIDADEAANTVSVTDAALLAPPAPFSQFVIRIGSEDMRVTAVAGNELTVVRSHGGTTVAAAEAGVDVKRVYGTTDSRLLLSDASPIKPGADIRINSEEMNVTHVDGNAITVTRAVDLTALGVHLSGHAVHVLERPRFLGFVGVGENAEGVSRDKGKLSWSEKLDHLVDQIEVDSDDPAEQEQGRITIGRLLGAVPDEPNNSPINRFDATRHTEVADPSVGQTGAAPADDETAGLEPSDGPASLNLARTEGEYGDALTDAWKQDSRGLPPQTVKTIPADFAKLKEGTFPGAAGDADAQAVFDMLKALLKNVPRDLNASPEPPSLDPPYLVCRIPEAMLTGPIDALEEKDELIARYRRIWEINEPDEGEERLRLWIVQEADGENQVLLLHRMASFDYKAKDSNGQGLEGRVYAADAEKAEKLLEGRGLTEATLAPVTPSSLDLSPFEEVVASRGMASGLLLAELLELLADKRVSGGKDYQEPDSKTAVPGERDEPYRIAPYLRLVMEFEDDDALTEFADPVSHLIELENEDNSPTSMTLGGQDDIHLVSVLGPRGKLAALPEYDLFPGPTYQSTEQIGVTWRFLREDAADVKRAGTDAADSTDAFLPYQELDKFVVTRTNLTRPADRPRTVEVLPVWFVAGTGGEKLVKPQFQFVDDDLRGVQEGDFLQYRVVAEATDRSLASFLINVRRRTLAPLGAVGQALAMHWINRNRPDAPPPPAPAPSDPPYRNGRFELLAAADLTLGSDANLNSPPTDREMSLIRELQLRYRLVPAPTVGSYGFELRPPVKTRLVRGVPSRRNDADFPDVRFAESEASRAVPWAETRKLNLDVKWSPIRILRRDPRSGDLQVVTSGFRAVIENEEELRRATGATAGQAVEFFIGREIAATRTDPLQRSPLTRCRHAVSPWNNSDTIDDFPDATRDATMILDFGRGNSVDAIEWLPAIAREPEYLNAKLIRASVNYPPAADKPESNPESPHIDLEWAHALGRRGRAVEADDREFDPVVGYRIHRFDRFDAARYVDSSQDMNSEATALERTVKVVPEAFYRSQPDTVEVLGLRTVDSAEPTIAAKDASPTSVDELVTRLTRESAGQGRGAIDLTPRADWVAADAPDWLPGPIATEIEPATTPATKPFAEESRETDLGPVWLHEVLWKVIERLAEGLEADAELGMARPLLDASPAELQSNEGDSATSRLEALIKELGPAADPYGWLTAEALGRSLECRFRTADGRPVRAEEVISALGKIADEEFELTPEVPAAGDVPAQPAKKATFSSLVQVAAFLGEDDRIPLDVVRLVLRPAWTDSDTSITLGLVRQLRLPHDPTSPGDSLTGVGLENFLKSANQRLLLLGKRPAVVLRQETRGELARAGTPQPGDPADKRAPDRAAGTVTLPIDARGRVSMELPVPDNWAHCYQIAVEPIRRYDRVRAMLRHPSDPQKSPPEPERIPKANWTEAAVDRTRGLVRHNLIATPLPGSIQALLFRHPAAFAATSNATSAAYGQYSGQTITFERRIQKELWDSLAYFRDVLPARVAAAGGQPIEWDAYRRWLLANNHESPDGQPVKGPVLIKRNDEEVEELSLESVPGTETGLYGADRFVLPDLPGYYEYRAVAYSTAGRRSSPIATTGWVRPQYDADVLHPDSPDLTKPLLTARQPPQTVPVARVDIVSEKPDAFTVELLLIHPRFHLRKQMRSLWVESDRVIDVGASGVKLGSLPDLALSYQVFFWQNYNPKKQTPPDDPVYVPLARVLSPVTGNATWFQTEAQFPGLKIDENDTFTPTVQIPETDPGELARGALRLRLRFVRKKENAGGAAAEGLFAVLRDAADMPPDMGGLEALFPINVERDGVRSKLNPLPPRVS